MPPETYLMASLPIYMLFCGEKTNHVSLTKITSFFAFSVRFSICGKSCSGSVQAALQQATKPAPKTALYATRKAAINFLDTSTKLRFESYLLKFHAQSLL